MRQVEAEQGCRHFDVLFVIQAVEEVYPAEKVPYLGKCGPCALLPLILLRASCCTKRNNIPGRTPIGDSFPFTAHLAGTPCRYPREYDDSFSSRRCEP